MKWAFLLSLTVATTTAWALPPRYDFRLPTGNTWDTQLFFDTYRSDGNFDKSGNTFTRHASGASYQSRGLDLAARRAWGSSRTHLYLRTSLATADAKSPTGILKTNSGVSDMEFGLDQVLARGSLITLGDFSLVLPFTKTERSASSTVAIGEGVTEVNGRVIVRAETRLFRFGGFGGLKFRDQKRSMLVPYGFLGEFKWGRWSLGTDLRGYQSLTMDGDSNSESAIEATYFCSVNGCAKQFGAFNPSILQNNWWIHHQASREFSWNAGISHDILGSNVSKGFHFYAGLGYRWPGGKPSSAPAKEAEFEEVIDDNVDQSAFSKPIIPDTNERAPTRPGRNVPIKQDMDATERMLEKQLEKQEEEP